MKPTELYMSRKDTDKELFLRRAVCSTVFIVDYLITSRGEEEYSRWYTRCNENRFAGIWDFTDVVAEFCMRVEGEWAMVSDKEIPFVADMGIHGREVGMTTIAEYGHIDSFYHYMADEFYEYLEDEECTPKRKGPGLLRVSMWASRFVNELKKGGAE